MRKISLSISLLFVLGVVFAQKKQIQVEEIWKEYKFFAKPAVGFNFMNNGLYYSRLEGYQQPQINEYNINSGKQTRSIYTADAGTRLSGYSFSADEKKILLEIDAEKIYRYSSKANFSIYDVDAKKSSPLSEGGKQRYATFNPAADKVAFVRENNLFYKDLESEEEIQITKDGKFNAIINGATDWVYEEEFAIDKAFFWSPDGSKIAFLRFDESEVKQFTMTYYMNNLYPDPSTFKYPKAGEKNAKVSVHIYDLKKKEILDVDVKGDKDQYIPRLKWTPKGQLCVYRMNRHQNELTLLLVNPKNGKTSELLKEKNEYFIDINDHLTFLNNGDFVWLSEKDGFNHIYLYNKKGKVKTQLTKGEWDVTDFYGVDAKNERIYFQAAKEKSVNREVYWVDFNAEAIHKLSVKEGTNSAEFSSTFEYYINHYSAATTPPVHSVFKTETNEEVRVIEDNSELNKLLSTYDLGEHKYFSFKNRDDIELNGWMMLPPNFDATKKYPVFMYVYGGPSAPTASNSWNNSNHMWFRMLTQQGYIVVTVDNRGTEPRGEEFRKATYMQLGKYEAIDQIDAAKHLAGLDYIDGDRIGIFGWSFGGYLSSLCLAKGADVFKMAIAVAPVTNWKWYDTIYTERYMRTPAENNDGYEQNSPINFADKIKGKYLLVHGFADDNVHFQHAAEMARVLIENNIDFDQMFYPNKNHGIYGGLTRLHLYNKMTNFILENL
jgi:dipeptidyl-peptidase-4